MQARCARVGLAVYTAADPARALEMAEHLANPEDLIVVTGSLHLVGAVLALRGDTDHHA